MHVPSLVKIPWHLHKLASRNKNMGMSRADNSVKIWRNLPISNPKSDLHNINAQTKFGENPLMFTQVIVRKWNTDRRMYDWQTDGQTDRHTALQRETIIPRHYCVVGYKKYTIQQFSLQKRVSHLDATKHADTKKNKKKQQFFEIKCLWKISILWVQKHHIWSLECKAFCLLSRNRNPRQWDTVIITKTEVNQ